MKIHSILLAAGQSSRMKRDKAFLEVGKKYTLDIILEKLLIFSNYITIVLANNFLQIDRHISINYSKYPIHCVFNPDHLVGGMFSSIKKGFYCTKKNHATMLNLIDQPFIKQDTYHKIISSMTEKVPLVIPMAQKDSRLKKGHPILFNRSFTDIQHAKENTFRDFLSPYYKSAFYVNVRDDGILQNLNEFELFQKAKIIYEKTNN